MGLVAVAPLGVGLAGMAGLRVHNGDHPVGGDLAGDPPASRPLAWLDVLAGDQRQQRDRLGLLGVQFQVSDRFEHGQGVVDQPRHQGLGGLRVIPGTHRLAWPVMVMRPKLYLARLRDEPSHPANRRDQLGDGVLGGDRIGQDGGVQHPPTPTPPRPGGLHHLADGVKDPPWPGRAADAVAPGHQHGGVEALVVQPQPAGDLPGDVAPQRVDGLPVAQALQGLQHHHGGDDLGGHRRVAAAVPDDIGEQLRREQLVTVVGKEGVHRPVGDQVAAPGGRVHLGVGAWRAGLMSPAVCPLSAPSANYRTDPAGQIDRNDRTTPLQQAPSRNPPAESTGPRLGAGFPGAAREARGRSLRIAMW
jgi:hypothetical protein